MIPNLLSIAGSDPGGGAGIQADIKTFGALGCHGMAILTALTAQNTRGVTGVFPVPPGFVRAQIDALFDDIRIDAVKTGMFGTADNAAAAAAALRTRANIPLVVDPVLAATSGDSLSGASGSAEVAAAIVRDLLPLASLVTPNLAEAAILSGLPVASDLAGMEQAGRAILVKGARAVLVKGGHLESGNATDILCTSEGSQAFSGRRVETRNTHGTGCTLSSAIAAHLAHGAPLPEAIIRAKAYLEAALASAHRLDAGGGHGPVDHFHMLRAI